MNNIKTINLISEPDSRFIVFSDAHQGDGTGAPERLKRAKYKRFAQRQIPAVE
ncbi:MAG: hypothetical protein Q8O55_13375 [Dehalococcoidales bacterium]|nr:hypothetical protein [Dehalococcoidales bacterium]